jgi:hypothetical protein
MVSRKLGETERVVSHCVVSWYGPMMRCEFVDSISSAKTARVRPPMPTSGRSADTCAATAIGREGTKE